MRRGAAGYFGWLATAVFHISVRASLSMVARISLICASSSVSDLRRPTQEPLAGSVKPLPSLKVMRRKSGFEAR